jgi:hypothetical protein
MKIQVEMFCDEAVTDQMPLGLEIINAYDECFPIVEKKSKKRGRCRPKKHVEDDEDDEPYGRPTLKSSSYSVWEFAIERLE